RDAVLSHPIGGALDAGGWPDREDLAALAVPYVLYGHGGGPFRDKETVPCLFLFPLRSHGGCRPERGITTERGANRPDPIEIGMRPASYNGGHSEGAMRSFRRIRAHRLFRANTSCDLIKCGNSC